MEEFEISKIHKVKVYESKDYIEKNKEVNDSFLNILSSYEYDNETFDITKARDYIENLNYEMYLSNLDTRIYVLSREDRPVSFAIYNRIEHTNDWVLELIYTHSEYVTLGLAGNLLRFSARDLKDRFGAENIHSTVAKNNHASFYLHNSFSKVDGVKGTTEDCDSRFKYCFDIRQMKSNKNKTSEEEMLF
ncbi:MAG: GNAT family N-acetyltransferase [Christensenellales bacterium]